MLSTLRRSSLLAVMAAILGAGCSVTAMATQSTTQPAMISAAPRQVRAGKRSLFGGATAASRYGRKGAGIGMAQQQRTSAKKRSVARNRRHHR